HWLDKALWVVRDKITEKGAIDDLMADATTRGIHDVVVQVRGRGDAYYASTLEPRAESLTGEFDPLAHLVRAGAAVGVRVHAWGNVFFVWSSPEGALPWAPEHLVRRHPVRNTCRICATGAARRACSERVQRGGRRVRRPERTRRAHPRGHRDDIDGRPVSRA